MLEDGADETIGEREVALTRQRLRKSLDNPQEDVGCALLHHALHQQRQVSNLPQAFHYVGTLGGRLAQFPFLHFSFNARLLKFGGSVDVVIVVVAVVDDI